MSNLLMRRCARISSCGRYRYMLTRTWREGEPTATFIMLNPSTADAAKDDQTIRKCVGFAQRWGMNGITVVNLFAFRATKPEDMRAVADPFGPECLHWQHQACLGRAKVICAWGNGGAYRNAGPAMLKYLHQSGVTPLALKLNPKSGHPQHPLYVPYEAQLVEMLP